MARQQQLGTRYAAGQSPVASVWGDTKKWREENLLGDIATSFIPGIAQAGAVQDAQSEFGQGNYGMGTLAALGAVPGFGAITKPLGKAIKASDKAMYARKPTDSITINGEKFDADGIMDAMDEFDVARKIKRDPKDVLTRDQIENNLKQGTLPYRAVEAVGEYTDKIANPRDAYNQLSKQGVQGSLAPRGVANSQSGLIGGLTDDIIDPNFNLVNTAGTAQAVRATGKTPQELAMDAIRSGNPNLQDEGYRSLAALASVRKANPQLGEYNLAFHGSDSPQLLKDMKGYAGGDYASGLGLGGQSHTWLGDSPLVASGAQGGFSGGKGVMIASKNPIAGDLTQVPRQVGNKMIGGSNQIAQNTDEFTKMLGGSSVTDIDLSREAVEKGIGQFNNDPSEILKYLGG